MSNVYIARSTAIASRVLAGETMVMSVTDSTFFTLNDVATAIWHAADGVTPLTEIVTQNVCPEFEITPQEAFTDAEEFVRELATHGILQVSDQPMPDQDSVAGAA